MTKCIECKIKISKTAKRCTQCHLKKLNNFQKLENAGGYKDGRTLKTCYCIKCGTRVNTRSFIYGSKLCHSCSAKNNPKQYSTSFGNKNINWKGGISKLPYPFTFTEALKILIRKRDNCRCRKCNKKKDYRELDVHHIDYNKQNCKKNNLITLCKKCHSKTNFDRDYWYAYFIYLMEERKCK